MSKFGAISNINADQSGTSTGEMPTGQMMGGTAISMAGNEITEMPIGNMSEAGSINEMPSGQGMGSTTISMVGMAISEMPAGNMSSTAGTDDFFSNQIIGAIAASAAGLEVTQMPIGSMANAEKPAIKGGGMEPLPTLEVTGQWRLTLSPTASTVLT